MNNNLPQCVHGRQFCISCHAVLEQRVDQTHQNAFALLGVGQQFPPGTATNQMYAEEQRARNMRDEALLQIAALAPMPVTIERQLTDAITYGLGVSQDGKHIPARDVYVVPADAPMVPGRKLTQALLEAGRQHREGHNDLAFYDESKAKWQDTPVTIDQAPAPRRSFISTTARVAFWIVLAVTVSIWIFAGVKS